MKNREMLNDEAKQKIKRGMKYCQVPGANYSLPGFALHCYIQFIFRLMQISEIPTRLGIAPKATHWIIMMFT